MISVESSLDLEPCVDQKNFSEFALKVENGFEVKHLKNLISYLSPAYKWRQKKAKKTHGLTNSVKKTHSLSHGLTNIVHTKRVSRY